MQKHSGENQQLPTPAHSAFISCSGTQLNFLQSQPHGRSVHFITHALQRNKIFKSTPSRLANAADDHIVNDGMCLTSSSEPSTSEECQHIHAANLAPDLNEANVEGPMLRLLLTVDLLERAEPVRWRVKHGWLSAQQPQPPPSKPCDIWFLIRLILSFAVNCLHVQAFFFLKRETLLKTRSQSNSVSTEARSHRPKQVGQVRCRSIDPRHRVAACNLPRMRICAAGTVRLAPGPGPIPQ